jgi:hypothetical protein
LRHHKYGGDVLRSQTALWKEVGFPSSWRPKHPEGVAAKTGQPPVTTSTVPPDAAAYFRAVSMATGNGGGGYGGGSGALPGGKGGTVDVVVVVGGEGGSTVKLPLLVAAALHVSRPLATPKPRVWRLKATEQACNDVRFGKTMDELEKQYVQAPLVPKSSTDSPGMVRSKKLAQLAGESSVGDM